jgi:VWFA-related protein
MGIFRETGVVAAVCVLAMCVQAPAQDANKPKAEDRAFTMSVPVNEVNLTFHVSDASGVPIEHLHQSDFELLDNGKLQKRIVAFREHSDMPIRVGFLLDNSPSMERQQERNQAIASELVKEFFRPEVDRAFTMGFGVESKVTLDWSGDGGAIANGIADAVERPESEREGTALFDAVYHACRDRFSQQSDARSGNFILLFTDGEDNSSRVWEPEAVDMCQRARTAIYVFIPEWKSRASRGQQILEDLAAKTGGRAFYQSKQSNHDDLAAAVTDVRYQYELVYAPASLKRDGSFHKIKLRSGEQRAQIQVRSGYYAYAKP